MSKKQPRGREALSLPHRPCEHPPCLCRRRRRELAKHGISCGGHSARQLTPQDYGEYDLLIAMDSGNLRAMHRICGGDPEGKMSLLMDHTARPGSVADPWYTDDFEATWRDVLEGCRGLLAELSGGALPSSPFPLP